MKKARAEWFGKLANVKVSDLVFLDEFAAVTNMIRTRGRGPVGERVVVKNPHGHWKVISTIAAITTRGMFACGSFDGATDTDTFLAFVEHGLLPRLRPGQVVIFDNLSAHLSPQIDRMIESVGARVVRLPPYSPDYNPIENAISKIKAILRKLGKRTVESLLEGIAEAVASITASDATGFFGHCGYAATAG